MKTKKTVIKSFCINCEEDTLQQVVEEKDTHTRNYLTSVCQKCGWTHINDKKYEKGN